MASTQDIEPQSKTSEHRISASFYELAPEERDAPVHVWLKGLEYRSKRKNQMPIGWKKPALRSSP